MPSLFFFFFKKVLTCKTSYANVMAYNKTTHSKKRKTKMNNNTTTLTLTDNQLHILDQALAAYEEQLWDKSDKIEADMNNCHRQGKELHDYDKARMELLKQKQKVAYDVAAMLPTKHFTLSLKVDMSQDQQ